MSRDQRTGGLRREDEDSADDRGQRKGVADGREDISGRFGVGADDLADDGGSGAVERHADRTEEEDDRSGRQAQGIVAGRVDIGPVGKTEGGHRKRNGTEKNADAVIHGGRFLAPRRKSRTTRRSGRE